MSPTPPTSAYRVAALALGLATSRTATRDEAERRLRLVADDDNVSGAREVLDRLRETDPSSARRARDLLDRAVPEGSSASADGPHLDVEPPRSLDLRDEVHDDARAVGA